ncbi:dysbindin-like [Osmerus eperlanus]|uniref:dysbindin-like n=1 Tax=Osmerus eperlanus TaxID=29151 RepID=UPI002E128A55
MSSTGSTNHNKRISSETDNNQRVVDNESSQPLKLRERQRFFEEVFQHDGDIYLASSHLHIDCRKPPMGSISSMAVNVDMLEQMDLMDISDQEALDVFLNSGADDAPLASPLPEVYDEDEEEDDESVEVVYRKGHYYVCPVTVAGGQSPACHQPHLDPVITVGAVQTPL